MAAKVLGREEMTTMGECLARPLTGKASNGSITSVTGALLRAGPLVGRLMRWEVG